MDITIILNQMIQLFIIIFIGFLLTKFNLFNEDFNKRMTKLILNVTLPAMILASVLNQTEGLELNEVLLVFILAISIYTIFPIISFLLVKILRIPYKEQGLYMFMNIFSNIGFMGFPILNALYGQTAVFYGAIFNLVFTLSSFTLGIPIITYGTKHNTKINLNNLKNTGVIISVIAICTYFSHISFPEVLGNTFTVIGNITTPAAMMLIGSNLSDMNFKNIFGDFKMYPFLALKQFLIPLFLFQIIKIFINNNFILCITLLMLIMPVANNSILFSIEYGNDERLASKVVFVSTLLSIFTIPSIIYICLG